MGNDLANTLAYACAQTVLEFKGDAMKNLVIVGGYYIVSIQYDRGVAPIVLSRGMGHMEKKIRELESAHVRILRDEALAQMLYCSVVAGKKLPVGLYRLLDDVLI